jgi:hypothetical protein
MNINENNCKQSKKRFNELCNKLSNDFKNNKLTFDDLRHIITQLDLYSRLELSSELFKAINESIPEKSKKALEVK